MSQRCLIREEKEERKRERERAGTTIARRRGARSDFFLRSSRNRIDLLWYYESKPTDKQEQYLGLDGREKLAGKKDEKSTEFLPFLCNILISLSSSFSSFQMDWRPKSHFYFCAYSISLLIFFTYWAWLQLILFWKAIIPTETAKQEMYIFENILP